LTVLCQKATVGANAGAAKSPENTGFLAFWDILGLVAGVVLLIISVFTYTCLPAQGEFADIAESLSRLFEGCISRVARWDQATRLAVPPDHDAAGQRLVGGELKHGVGNVVETEERLRNVQLPALHGR